MTNDHIVLFEDDSALSLEPLSLTRPVWRLRCGIRTLGEKILAHFPAEKVFEFARPHLKPILDYPLEDPFSTPEKTLWINGGMIPGIEFDAVKRLQLGSALVSAGNVIAFRGRAPADWQAGTRCKLNGFHIMEAPVNIGNLVRYPWQLVQVMNDQNAFEARELRNLGQMQSERYPLAVLVNEKDIFLAKSVQISPFAVLDASEGPIVIDENVRIGSHAVIEGPTVIGEHSQVKPLTHIRGSCLGPHSRVGGEISVSIIQGYSNKQHGGFLGHSFLGQWCNLGSGTETSNLKNNYTNVKVQVGDKLMDTGQLFVGLTMGDHSKTAIGSVFNTGTVVGVGCMIFGAGFPPRFVPSFHWGGAEKLTRYPLKSTLEIAQAVMGRRGEVLSDAEIEVLTWIYKNRT
jgi:UDP-N-acetylglucosamine diphosphorylase/glucosamine-1-phosphate N-acetyltransferase